MFWKRWHNTRQQRGNEALKLSNIETFQQKHFWTKIQQNLLAENSQQLQCRKLLLLLRCYIPTFYFNLISCFCSSVTVYLLTLSKTYLLTYILDVSYIVDCVLWPADHVLLSQLVQGRISGPEAASLERPVPPCQIVSLTPASLIPLKPEFRWGRRQNRTINHNLKISPRD